MRFGLNLQFWVNVTYCLERYWILYLKWHRIHEKQKWWLQHWAYRSESGTPNTIGFIPCWSFSLEEHLFTAILSDKKCQLLFCSEIVERRLTLLCWLLHEILCACAYARGVWCLAAIWKNRIHLQSARCFLPLKVWKSQSDTC